VGEHRPDEAFSELRSERLELQRFRPDDLAAFVAYRSDPAVARYQGWAMPFPLEAGASWPRWPLLTRAPRGSGSSSPSRCAGAA